MKYEVTFLALAGLASAREVSLYNAVVKREVPQEHSHQAILATTNTNLQLNNPLKIEDAVFALLGNAAAAAGAPNVQNLDCLQQIVADQAFTNAKAAGDVDGQANAIMFRALERNTGTVGQASVLCDEIAANSEIAAISQHQDPASSAASGNKQIALNVATQLSSIGADPTLAINTGTFAPGNLDDTTGKGNTCDDANDPVGCIISQNLLVPDVTAAEITAAVGSSAANRCRASKAAKKMKKKRSRKYRRAAALDFGSYSNPAIAFGPQSDRGGADAFAAVDEADFNHGSALAINVISSFICGQLGSSCKAAAAAVRACDAAAAAAKAETGQAAADAFNSALGV
ncbi:unnamed protein product [Discula destructiva]